MRTQSTLPLKARVPVLAPDVSTLAAFRAIVSAAQAQIQASRLGVITGSDPEYLHQMRVAVRRLRSVCAAYSKFFPNTMLLSLLTELK